MAYCKPTGVPWINSIPLPYKIVQTPQLILILYEESTVFRQIFLDGRKPVRGRGAAFHGLFDRPMGRRRARRRHGRLDGSVVARRNGPPAHASNCAWSSDSAGATRATWTSRSRSTIPGAYTRPITYTITTTAIPDDELLEYFCTENEKSSAHYE